MMDVLQRKVMAVESDASSEETLDPRVLSSVLINVKMAASQEDGSNKDKDPHARLLELMHSSPVGALLDAASVFAKRQSMAPHEALQQIIMSLQEIDQLWNQVLLKEGVARLSSQYH